MKMTPEAIIGLLDARRLPGGYLVKEDKIFFTASTDDYSPSGVSDKDRSTDDPKRWTKWRRSNFEYFKKGLSNFSDGKTLIDVGSGQGRFRAILTRFNYIGIDFYPYPLVNVVADVTKGLPFRDSCCDIVVLSNVLEHHTNPQALLEESHRILRPDGCIVGAVPFLLKVHQEPYDFLRYTNFMLEKMLTEAGFHQASVGPLGVPVDLVETTQRRFFVQLYGSTLTKPERRIAAVSEKVIKVIFTLCRRIFQKAKQSTKFTEGYGFIARK